MFLGKKNHFFFLLFCLQYLLFCLKIHLVLKKESHFFIFCLVKGDLDAADMKPVVSVGLLKLLEKFGL